MALTPEEQTRLEYLRARRQERQGQPDAAAQGYNAQEAPSVARNVKEGLAELPGFLKGALNKTRETTAQPILRFLANRGFEPAKKEIEALDAFRASHVPEPGEKAGEFTADAAMLMAPTPFGKAGTATRIIGAAAQGTAQHQAQNYARTGEVDPVEAAGEMAFSTAIPFAGAGIGKGAKSLAPKVLDGLTPKRMRGDADWNYALRNNLVPYFKGSQGITDRAAPKIAARGNLRDQLLDDSKSKVNVMEQIQKTLKGLRKSVGAKGADRIRNDQYQSALRYGDDALLTAGKQVAPGSEVVGLRKLADDAVGEAGFENAPAEAKAAAVFYKPYRENLEEALLNSMRPKDVTAMSKEVSRAAKRGGPLEIDRVLAENEMQKARMGRYIANKYTLAKLTPIDIAARDMAKSGHRLGNMIDLGIAGGGLTTSLYGNDSPVPALGALATIAARRGTMSPTGARLLFDLGRGAQKKATKETGRAMLNLSRSAIFGDNE